jgi:hypothetical protein
MAKAPFQTDNNMDRELARASFFRRVIGIRYEPLAVGSSNVEAITMRSVEQKP